MFDRILRLRMTPLGKEILEALERGDRWRVSKDGEDWRHEKSGLELCNWSHALRVWSIPHVEVMPENRRALLNVFDQLVLKRVMKRMLRNKQNSTSAQIINVLRLAQHKENQP